MVARRTKTKRIVMLVFEGAQALDVTGPLEVFGAVNEIAASLEPELPSPYEIEIVSERAGPVQMSSGIRIMADRSFVRYRSRIDTLLVAGGRGVFSGIADDGLIRFLKRSVCEASRVASICTGAFLLASIGLLDGKRATTHWRYVDRLGKNYPRVEVEADAIFVEAGSVYTSAGVTAGIDLALELVRCDMGKKMALEIARELVVFLSRPGGQSQFSRYLEGQTLSEGDFSNLTDWLVENLDREISVDSMANFCGMSPRNFARIFSKKMDTTPAKHLERLRLEKARLLMDHEGLALKTVINRCGFASHEHFRRSFKRSFHVNPQDYRKHF